MALEGRIDVRIFTVLGCLVLLVGRAGCARPRFDTSTDMGLVLVPADAEVESVIYRLRATDQDADFPLIFDVTATVTPIVRIENLPCTLYNKICQANVILTRRLTPGRLHDFAVRVRDSKGDSNNMQATISVTNATTQRNKIFPHIPAIIMVPEDAKTGKELDYILVRSNQWSGKPVYIELWQPKELFTIRQRQTPSETRGVITLIGELDFETQSMYTLTIYATDPYTEPKKDTRNIAGLHLVVIVQDVQDVPPIFILAPPLTKINNTVQPGDVILRVHAEDGDKGVPRDVTYGLVSEGNPFTPFFNISETTGEIILARPLEELTKITHVGAPVVLSVVAEEIRRSTMEPPAQATVVEVGLLLGEPGNSPPFFENDNYVGWMNENAEPGTPVTFTEHYSTKVRDEDIGKAGVFALKLYNNNGTFEISPTVAERTANFVITVRDNNLMDYEIHKSLRFMIIAQEVGPATNLSASVPATIFLRDVNDNPPEFEEPSYEVTLSENVTAGTRVVQVHATDKDTGSFGRIQYTKIVGVGSEAFVIDPDTGAITVSMKTSILDRETTSSLRLTVEARDEDGKGLRGIVSLTVNLLDVNDNPPIFEKLNYQFTLNENMTNFTTPAVIKATDADAEPPNNEIRYEIIHGNYDEKFYVNEITGEIFLREPINKVRRTRHDVYQNFATKLRNGVVKVQRTFRNVTVSSTTAATFTESSMKANDDNNETDSATTIRNYFPRIRKKREDDDVMFTMTARAYDLGVPHMSGVTQVIVMRIPMTGARTVMFVVPGENPDPVKTAETLAAITGGRITVKEIRPYTIKDIPNGSSTNVPSPEGRKKSIVVARVEPIAGETSFVDIERIRTALTANGVGVIGGDMPIGDMKMDNQPKSNNEGANNQNGRTNTITNITTVNNEQVTIYKAENRLLFWLLIILGLLMLVALIIAIVCCICPGCPFYMAPRKRRVHSSETLLTRSDARPKRHLHRTWQEKKQAWSADATRRNWHFNRRNRRAPGLASLPGDVRTIDREQEILEKTGSLRLRDSHVPMYHTDPSRRPNDERIYMEDVEGHRGQDYGIVDVESLRRRDDDRNADSMRRIYVTDGDKRLNEQSKFVREQHFYRDGNTEVLRLITRGQMDEAMMVHPMRRPQTLVVDHHGQSGAYRIDGKEILLQRFIEDQGMRQAIDGQGLHDSFQDIERPAMESHQRQRETMNFQQQQQLQQQQQQQPQQQKILLIPERLEDDHRQHIEELGPDVQRLIIDHGSFEKTPKFETTGNTEITSNATLLVHAPMTKVSDEKSKESESVQNTNNQRCSIRDVEIARQNVLLTRLLLERDGRDVTAGGLIDSASYLETQSLPGQVAIATQTDRTTATQTELPNRSRSDNDESEEEARMRKKLKSKKRHADGEPRRVRTMWMKSPIKEEDMRYFADKRTVVVRKKMKDVKDVRRVSLEAQVLQEISDSLEENGDPPIMARMRDDKVDSFSREDSRNGDGNERFEDSSSLEMTARDGRRMTQTRRETRNMADCDAEERRNHRMQREDILVPSLRMLEKEMTSLSKKLSKFAGKKIFQSSNGSETDSRDKIEKIDTKMDSKVVETEKVTKMAEVTEMKRGKSMERIASPECVRTEERVRIRDKDVIEKQMRPASSKKSENASTGRSNLEDTSVEPSKQNLTLGQLKNQNQTASITSHGKLERQSKVEDKHKEKTKEAPLVRLQETAKQEDTSESTSKELTGSVQSENNSMVIKKSSNEDNKEKTNSEHVSKPSPDDLKLKSDVLPTVDVSQMTTTKINEASGKTLRPEILILSPVESVKDVSLDKTVVEVEQKSPEPPKMDLEILPGTVKREDTVGLHLSEKIVADESSAPANPQLGSSKGVTTMKLVEAIKDEVTLVSKKDLNDFLSREMINDRQTSEAQDNLTTEGAEGIKGIIMESVVVENEDKKTEEATQKKVSDDAEAVDSRCIDATQKEKLESSKLEDKQNFDVVQVKNSFENIELRTNKIIVEEKEKISELVELEDEEKPSALQKEEVSGIDEKNDDKMIETMLEKKVIETIKTNDEKGSDALQMENLEQPIELKDDEMSNATEQQKEVSESMKLDKPEDLGHASKEIGEVKNVDQKIEVTKITSEKSEDPGEFSDNFDSFCGTLTHPKSYSDKRRTDDEFSYETLQSESSEEQMTPEKIADIKNVVEKVIVIQNVVESMEMSLHSDDKTKEDVQQPAVSPPEEPRQPPSDDEPEKIADIKNVVEKVIVIQNVVESMEMYLHSDNKTRQDVQQPAVSPPEEPTRPPVNDEPSDDLAKVATDQTTSPVLRESEQSPDRIKETKVEVKIDDSTAIPVAKSADDTKTTMEDQSDDIPKNAEQPLATPKTEKITVERSESHMANVPIVPLLDIKITDESNIHPLESHSEPSDFNSKTPEASSSPLSSPVASILETGMQKEFGIADSLFVDAKLLKSPSGSARKVEIETETKNQQQESSMNEPSTIGTDSQPVNFVELSRVLFDDEDDDSDSSEASSRTMLTARPYGTPRHRPISGSENVEAANPTEHESINEPVKVELKSTTDEISKEMPPSPEKADESLEGSSKIDARSLPEETVRNLEEKPSDILIKTGKIVSERINDNVVTSIDPVSTDSISTANENAHSKMPSDKRPETSISNNDADAKMVDTNADREGDATPDGTLEKVQQLYQIRREKLPADADGFDSLPETGERVKNLGDAKLPEGSIGLPNVAAGKTGAETPVAEISGVGTKKAVTSTGKDTKTLVRRRDASKEDTIKGTRKIVATTSKSSSPKREKKMATTKADSSKNGKQSTATVQPGRVRDVKRIVRRASSQADEPAESVSRTGQIKRTLSKIDRPGKDGKDDDKLKSEKSKKLLSKSEVEKSKNPRPGVRRGSQAKIKDSGMTKGLEKSVKTGRIRKNVGDKAKEKTLELGRIENVDQREVVEKSGDSRGEEVGETIDSSKGGNVELLSTTGNDELEMPSPSSKKEDGGDMKAVLEPALLGKSEGLHEEITTDLEMIVSSNGKEKIPPNIVENIEDQESAKDLAMSSEKTATKESTMVEQSKSELRKDETQWSTPSESPKTHDVPVTIESTVATDIDTTTPDVTRSSEKIIKPSGQITEGPVETQTSNVQSKTEENIPLAFKEEEAAESEAAERIKSPLKITDQVDVSTSPNKHSDLAPDDLEVKKHFEAPAEEITSVKSEGLDKTQMAEATMEKTTTSPRKSTKHLRSTETMIHEGQSRYMEWYKLKREEMERKRQERKNGDEEEEKPKWLRRSTRQRWFKVGPGDKKMFDPKIGDANGRRRKIKPRVNVESEQLKAIVRQGRALRKAQGEKSDEPQIQIFVPDRPATPLSAENSRCHNHHHLVQHSEYKYEKMPIAPFYLHPPIDPHSTSHASPQSYDDYQSLPTDSRCTDEGFDSGIVVQLQPGGNKLRHQQILEKKSVFDIAYDEAAPSQLRADSTTPPS